MSYESSMVYTMGTALSRALEDQSSVDVLVDGAWLSGVVVLYDGYGVVLDNGDEHSIVKVERVTAVRVLTRSPMRVSIEGPFADFSGPIPMPGPVPEPRVATAI